MYSKIFLVLPHTFIYNFVIMSDDIGCMRFGTFSDEQRKKRMIGHMKYQ